MKKLTLTIAKPCHENWNGMTPEERGHFCATCQKTVVDFTNLSDRQIADYFQKAKGEQCGRFYADQLSRELVIPKKPVPWMKYFFTVTWPAFVLLLKSCGQKNEVMGKMFYRHEVTNTAIVENAATRAVMGDTTIVEPVEAVKASCNVTKVEVAVIHPNGKKARLTPPIQAIAEKKQCGNNSRSWNYSRGLLSKTRHSNLSSGA